MAIQSQYILRRNATPEDTTAFTYFIVNVTGYNEQTGEFSYASTPEGGLPSVDSLGWSNSGYVFKEWNTANDGSGVSFSIGDYPPIDVQYDSGWNIFAIWEEEHTKKNLTSIFSYNAKVPLTDGETRRKWLLQFKGLGSARGSVPFLLGTDDDEAIAFGDTLILTKKFSG